MDDSSATPKQTPLYATLLYSVRERLGVSWTEYIYLDMVHKLSYGRWCTKSVENCARDLGMTKRGTSKMKERLINQGLLRRNTYGYLKVTDKYTEVAVNSVQYPVDKSVNSVPRSVNSVPPIGELSSTKSYNRITYRNKLPEKFNSNGTISLAWQEAKLKGKVQ